MEFIDGRSKGFGFVCFEKEEEAQSAIASLNGLVLKGQALHVSVATEKRNDKDNAASDDMKSDTSANGENKEGDQAGTEGNTTQGNAGKPHNNRSGNYRGRRGGGRGGRGGYHPRNYAQPPVGYGYIAPPQFVYYATENGVVPFPAYSPAAAVTGAYPVPTGQWAAGMPVRSVHISLINDEYSERKTYF
jgi:RNA recognition motif-containing protein